MDGVEASAAGWSAAAEADFAPGLERVFERLPKEAGYTVERVEGTIPAALAGAYYLNGPARFQRGGVAYHHWLDGDGMVCRLGFDGSGGAEFRCRWVDSTKRRDEEAAGEALYRAFGTAFDGDRLRRNTGLESPVNVSVYPFAGRLLAYGEQGLPWELDPETLETLGEHTFGGRLNVLSPLSAHPCFDPETGEMLNFGVSFAARRPCVHLYRFAANGELVYRRRIGLPFPCSMHDFGISRRYAVFYAAPYLMEMERLLAAGGSVMECLAWRPELGTRLVVADREDGAPLAEIPVGGGYCLHLVNAFDHEDRLTVDVVELDRPVYDQYEPLPDLFRRVTPGRPVRLVIDTRRWKLIERRELAYDRAPDFPATDVRLHGKPYRDFWMLGISKTGRVGRKTFDQLVHCGWRRPEPNGVWQAPAGCYLGGEPVLLPDPAAAPGDDAGWVICQEYDANRDAGAFLLFEAHAVERGPIARLPLAEPVPLGFHASFRAD